jgi:predicted nucleotidyltransferase
MTLMAAINVVSAGWEKSPESAQGNRKASLCPARPVTRKSASREPSHRSNSVTSRTAISLTPCKRPIAVRDNKLMNVPVPSLDALRAQLRALLPELRQRYGVETLQIFGSYLRGEATPASDLDLLVTFSQPPSLFQFIALENFLSETLGVKVDLVMKDALKPRIGKHILREVGLFKDLIDFICNKAQLFCIEFSRIPEENSP